VTTGLFSFAMGWDQIPISKMNFEHQKANWFLSNP